MLKEKINYLKGEIISYGDLVIKMVEKSIEGFYKSNLELLNEVIKIDEPVSNKYEIKIDEIGIGLIALFQPEAMDLRTVLSILKINMDLERIADLSVNIAQYSIGNLKSDVKSGFKINNNNSENNIKNDINKMGKKVLIMLKKGFQSLIDENINIANHVLMLDDEIDNFQRFVDKKMIELIKNRPDIVEYAFNIIKIAQNFERIADMTTNICEEVIYMEKGKVVKHHYENGKENNNYKKF